MQPNESGAVGSKSMPELNQERLEQLAGLELMLAAVKDSGVLLPALQDKVEASIRYFLGDELEPNPNDDLEKEEAEAAWREALLANLKPLMSALHEQAQAFLDERRRHKEELNGYRKFGPLDQVRATVETSKVREGALARLTDEARNLREAKKQLTEARDRLEALCSQLTAGVTEAVAERDRLRALCGQLAAKVTELAGQRTS